MEPVTAIVSAIVPLIANKALEKGGEKLGESGYNTINQIIAAIRNKFKKVGREGILIDVEAKPTEENRSELEATLEKQMKQDDDFTQTLREFVQQLKSEGVITSNIPQAGNVTQTATLRNFKAGRDQIIRDINKNEK